MLRLTPTHVGSALFGGFLLAVMSPAFCAQINLKEGMLPVLPIRSTTLKPAEATMIADAVRRELNAGGVPSTTAEQVNAALADAGCASEEMHGHESCMRLVCSGLKSKLVALVTVNSIGSLYEAEAGVFGATSGKLLWKGMYQVRGSIEDFYLQFPAKFVADIPRQLEEADPAPAKPHVHMYDQAGHRHAAGETCTESHEDAVEQAQEATEDSIEHAVEVAEDRKEAAEDAAAGARFGIAPGLVIGASAMFAMGDKWEQQSPFGVKMMALYPTGARGHVRLKGGFPLNDNAKADLQRDKDIDAYLSLEHEWAGRGGAIGVGFSYMYMRYMVMKGTHLSQFADDTYRAYYDPAHAVNMTVSLRGGKPNAGFYGRISWPLPYIFGDDKPDSYFLEYSALGVFGGKRVKAGVGVSGMYKYREADYVRQGDTTYRYTEQSRDERMWGTTNPYYEYENSEYSEFMALIPVLRVAGLIASRIVVVFNLELGETIFPRSFGSDNDSWAPSIGFDLIYSLKKLQGADLMDGTF